MTGVPWRAAVRDAAGSRGRFPIRAHTSSTAGNDTSRIVSRFAALVTTPYSQAGLVVTENAVADLRGRSLLQRVRSLIGIDVPGIVPTSTVRSMCHGAGATLGFRECPEEIMMRRAMIVAPVRTPVGKFGGALRPVPVEELAATVAKSVVQRSGVDPARIDDVVFAQSYANSEVPCVGRWVALQAGFPIEVPGMQLDRRCGGGLQAIVTAAMMVETGAADVVLAGGVESMSNIEYYSTDMRWGKRAGNVHLYDRLARGRERSQPVERFGKISGMIETAENLARDYHITRGQADAYAVRSHQRAAAAWKDGRFAEEVIPVIVPQRKGDTIRFEQDEGIRPDAAIEGLGKLKPLIAGGTVTAGNASQQNDASAACLVVADDKLAGLNLAPIASLVGWSAAGCDPSRMGIGPVAAVRKLLTRLKMKLDQMDLVELNEAFACQVLSVLKGWEWADQDAIENKLNVNGSGISLGHPIGATGVRIMATLLYELRRRHGRFGLETMCIGGGQGMAAVFERE